MEAELPGAWAWFSPGDFVVHNPYLSQLSPPPRQPRQSPALLHLHDEAGERAGSVVGASCSRDRPQRGAGREAAQGCVRGWGRAGGDAVLLV